MKAVAVSMLAVLLIGTVVFAGAADDPILRDAIPNKWLQRALPEDLPELELPEYIKTSAIDLAEAQAFAGRYKLSLVTVRKTGAVDAARVAMLRANSLWALGRTEEAMAAIRDATASANPAAQVLTARILDSIENTPAAIELLQKHLEGHPESIAGHYYLGAFSERIGDLKVARQQYEWFVTPPHNFLDLWLGQADRAFENAEHVTLIGRALDRWAILTSAYKDSVQLHGTILNMFVKAYDVIDRDYWPAHVAAAEYYIAHDNPAKAFAELEAANRANPRSFEIDRLMGELMLATGKYDVVEELIESLRDVNSGSIEADVLEARLNLRTGLRDEGAAMLEKVLAERPRRVDVIGLLAGNHLARARDKQADELFAKADAISPGASLPYEEAAIQLYYGHQTKPAIELLRTAIDREPWSTQARNLLGVLYLHSGEDDLARAALEAAYALDPFNPATVNYLRLLDDTAKFLRHETDHFIFMYASQDDPVVPLYFAPFMETAYQEVCKDLKYEPKEKTIIQVYPDSEAFSVRMSGMPGIETYAAAFGRLIIAAAPRAKQNIGPFNWGRVLKHEFAHVVHLTMTEGRVPRWLTEGLAVMTEQVDYRFEWVPPVFYKRSIERKLFKVAELNQVYARPKASRDGEIAYMTGFWIGRYLKETYGEESINKLLAAYKDGESDDDAFKRATGQPLATVETGFANWAHKQVSGWGYDKATAELYESQYKDGERLVKQNKLDEAIAAYQAAAKLQPMNPQPHRRLAGIFLKLKQFDKALPQLESLVPLELTDNRFAKRIAGIYRDANDLPKAVASAETAVMIDPYDPSAHDLLGALYQKVEKPEQAAKEAEVAQMLRDRKAEELKSELAPPANAD